MSFIRIKFVQQFVKMKEVYKIIFFSLLFISLTGIVSADRGYGKKKNKIALNIPVTTTLKKSISFSLRSGLAYRGSMLFDQQQIGNSVVNNAVISFKKGNTLYVLPYKQKVLISDYSANSGYKLIIRHK